MMMKQQECASGFDDTILEEQEHQDDLPIGLNWDAGMEEFLRDYNETKRWIDSNTSDETDKI